MSPKAVQLVFATYFTMQSFFNALNRFISRRCLWSYPFRQHWTLLLGRVRTTGSLFKFLKNNFKKSGTLYKHILKVHSWHILPNARNFGKEQFAFSNSHLKKSHRQHTSKLWKVPNLYLHIFHPTDYFKNTKFAVSREREIGWRNPLAVM